MLKRMRQRWPGERAGRWNLMWWIASRAWTKWVSKDFESFGADSLLVLPCWLYGVDGIRIGDRVQIGPSCRLGALGGAKLVIGDKSELVAACSLFAQTEGIEIGTGVLMAPNVQIYDAQHAIADTERPIRLQGVARGGKVYIRDGAWLGANVVVMPGVTIGCNAVIGANSVVTKDIPDYAIAAGSPAAVRSSNRREAQAR